MSNNDSQVLTDDKVNKIIETLRLQLDDSLRCIDMMGDLKKQMLRDEFVKMVNTIKVDNKVNEG